MCNDGQQRCILLVQEWDWHRCVDSTAHPDNPGIEGGMLLRTYYPWSFSQDRGYVQLCDDSGAPIETAKACVSGLILSGY